VPERDLKPGWQRVKFGDVVGSPKNAAATRLRLDMSGTSALSISILKSCVSGDGVMWRMELPSQVFSSRDRCCSASVGHINARLR